MNEYFNGLKLSTAFQTMEKCFSFLGFLAYLGYLAAVLSVWFLIVNPPTDPESGKSSRFELQTVSATDSVDPEKV